MGKKKKRKPKKILKPSDNELYEDSVRFRIYERMMKENRGVRVE